MGRCREAPPEASRALARPCVVSACRAARSLGGRVTAAAAAPGACRAVARTNGCPRPGTCSATSRRLRATSRSRTSWWPGSKIRSTCGPCHSARTFPANSTNQTHALVAAVTRTGSARQSNHTAVAGTLERTHERSTDTRSIRRRSNSADTERTYQPAHESLIEGKPTATPARSRRYGTLRSSSCSVPSSAIAIISADVRIFVAPEVLETFTFAAIDVRPLDRCSRERGDDRRTCAV